MSGALASRKGAKGGIRIKGWGGLGLGPHGGAGAGRGGGRRGQAGGEEGGGGHWWGVVWLVSMKTKLRQRRKIT